MHDVVIVGASIAGAATAIQLARRGRRVLLIDRATFPRRKVCGEGLFPAGVAVLAQLGVLDVLRDEYAPIDGIRFRADGHEATAKLGKAGHPAIGVRRSLLDQALLLAARDAGVEIRTGVTARSLVIRDRRVQAVATDQGAIAGRAFVAADGARSRLRRLAHLEHTTGPSRYGVSAHLRLPTCPPPLVDVTFGGDFECYLTPVGGQDVNAAILLRRKAMPPFAGNVEAAYRRHLALSLPLQGGFELLEPPRVTGPFPAASTRAWRANFVLAGDAAGFFDGITGEGMSIALVSSQDCARAVDTFLATGSYDPLRAYDRQRRSLARNSTLLARLTLALGRRPWLARWAVGNLANRPETFDRLVAINSGESGLRTLRPCDLAALLFGR